MTDLIKRDDALAAIDTFRRDFEQSWKVQFRADIRALPAVPTHRYAGESEASVYNRKGFPPIGLQGHAHAPVADSHPAIDTAAIREAALAAQSYSYIGKDMKPILARDLEDAKDAAEAKLAKAVEALRSVEDEYNDIQWGPELQSIKQVRAVLAELEGKE